MAKAWVKRMIWFFSYELLTLLDEGSYYLIHGVSAYSGENGIWIVITKLGILTIPLIFMKDDG